MSRRQAARPAKPVSLWWLRLILAWIVLGVAVGGIYTLVLVAHS